ncbi:MAG: DNA gyrase subunit A [Actinomycetota bacterium]|nr:DNA gyrase subunit A [Actinomycetota bacterium]MED5344565.1 DNA gyrase subunit A [Actinomycetota bacterium]
MPDDIDTIDATAGGEPPEVTRVEPVDLQTEMQRSYLDYSMSVIVSRALPDVRDGLKPVHRRVLYAMYDGGYRPDRNFSKSARVVGDVMGNYHPHGDSAIYDALVRLAQPWSLRYPLVQGQGNFGSPGNDPPAAQRYTECRMAQLAMETVRDIDEETVDFAPNYDGRTLEPTVLPSRFPNLLVNGSAGIAVGMATNIPPHNLGEVAEAATWLLNNPEAPTEVRLTALLAIVKGPDFPTGATIIGKRGVQDAYRTGRGSITMRAVVEVDEDAKGRQRLIVTELPYQVNPDNLLLRIAELVGDGKLTGISDVRDDSSSRTGMRLIIDLKRDAVAQVVLNQLYKHTQLQDNFGANMLALVDGVPRTLTLEQFLRYWIAHQIEVIQRRTRYRLRKAEERAHILRGYLKALDALDDVIALIRASATVEDARTGLMELLEIDELQATAILDMQLRRLAAMERQKIVDEYDELMTKIADYNDILTNEPRQRLMVSEELAEIVGKYGDDRRTEILPWDGEVTDEDLIAEEDVVVTITSGGYAKRTRSDLYRAQRRGGRGVRGAALRQDDVVEHFMVTSTHNWLLFFTNQGRIYRAKGYQLPDASRDAKGQHVANLLAFRPEETIASVLSIPGYDAADYLVLATRSGQVKKTRLSDYDTNRQGGIIAINLAEDDEVIGARLVSTEDDIFLASTKGMSVRFTASDEILRPMGRDTRGVIGMRFREGDSLLSMDIVRPGQHIVTITDGGFAKRTLEEEWAARNRGILGVRAMKIDEKRGSLVAAMICDPDDQIFAIASNGVVIRTAVSELRPSGRDTMGVTMMRLGDEDSVVAVARSGEKASEDDISDDVQDVTEPGESDAAAVESQEGDSA